MSETPDTVHGRLLESVHIAGYTWKRACDELDWMLDENRWQQVGSGYTNINDFLATVDLSEFRIAVERRKGLALKLKELEAANTATARALGVDEGTIRGDTRTENSESVTTEAPVQADVTATISENSEQAWFQDDLDPARLSKTRAARMQRERNAEARANEPAPEITETDDIQIRHGDLRTILDDLAGQVDAFVTDPPYPGEFLDEFDALGELAARLLKPDGLLVAMVGQTHLPEYIRRLGQHLTYRWCGSYLTDGPATRIHGRSVGTKWKPLLIYGGSSFITQDVFSSSQDDKEHHHWGQSESGMADIVARLTQPGQLVVDPFLGGGTTAVVCRELGRRFVGCDIDEKAINATRRRLA